MENSHIISFYHSNSKFVDMKCKICSNILEPYSIRNEFITLECECWNDEDISGSHYYVQLSKRFAKIVAERYEFEDNIYIFFVYDKKKSAILMIEGIKKELPYKKFKKLTYEEMKKEIERYVMLK